MKTIHIQNYVEILPGNLIYTKDVTKLMVLVRQLYEYTLKDDPDFHFFFEPEIIIRIGSEECLKSVRKFLSDKGISFREYDYPFPSDGGFGEARDGIVARNLDIFLKIFHANSVAAITMDGRDHFDYLERLIHTAFNPKFYSLDQEGMTLLRLAELKLGKDKIMEIMAKENK